jgi:hypothetical protein
VPIRVVQNLIQSRLSATVASRLPILTGMFRLQRFSITLVHKTMKYMTVFEITKKPFHG